MTGQELENCGEDDRGALKSREPCPLSKGCITPGLLSNAALGREQAPAEVLGMLHCTGGMKVES